MYYDLSSFLVSEKSCSIVNSWKEPLYDPYGNSINPCFFSFILSVVNLVFLGPVVYQILNYLFFNYFGPYKIKYSFGNVFKLKSVGIFTLIRIQSIFTHLLLTIILLAFEFKSFTDGKSVGIIINLVTLLFAVFPLHIIEPTRSIIPCTSLSFYWLVSAVLNFVILVQDTFSPHKIYVPAAGDSVQSAVYVIEILLVINALCIFFLEIKYYTPSVELIQYFDLNGWDYTRERPVFTRFFFYYLNDLLVSARKTDNIELSDLPKYPIDVDNDVAYSQFLIHWKNSVVKTNETNRKSLEAAKKSGKKYVPKTPSLFIPIIRLTRGYFLRSMFFDFLEFFAQITQPFLLRRFLVFASNRYFTKTQSQAYDDNSTPEPLIVGFTVATCIYFIAVVRYIAFNRFFINVQTQSHIIETALGSHVYHKGTRLSPKARKSKSVSEIINNMAQDVSTLDTCPEIITDIITQPFRLVLYIYSLYKFLGVSAIAGLLTALVLIPFATACYKFVFQQYNIQMKYKDMRAKLMGEILNSIKSIKLYSWESPMLKRLFEIRNDKELKVLKKVGVLSTMIGFLWDMIPYGIAVSTFVCAAKFANIPLTPDVIFPSLTIFDLLSGPILSLPGIFSTIAETRVSLARLVKFFTMEELEVEEYERYTDASVKKGEESVIIKDATFVWSKETEEELSVKELNKPSVEEEENLIEGTEVVNATALTDINFTAKKGELSCVVGRVGSGKTTFLRAILGSIPVESKDIKPELKVMGSMAYCSQNAWILNSSVRENILFGRKYDKAFYQQTVDACELTKDFDVLPDGDKTMVGEKGISLSGGQKARISLARAVYSKADIYILDDVLSAVDTHVGKHIIKNVLGKSGLLANKTTILATNSVPVLHEADNIVLLAGGKITERGTFDEVMSTDSELANLIKEFGKKESQEESVQEESAVQEASIPAPLKSDASSEDENEPREFKPLPDYEEGLALTKTLTNVTLAPSFVSFGHSYDADFDDEDVARRTGDTNEIQKKGKVNLMIYNKYLKACGWGYVFLYMGLLVLATLFTLSNTYVLKHWSEENLKYGHNVNITFYLLLYAGVGVMTLLFTLCSDLIITTVVAINGSKYFHDSMAKSVLRSPMSFFETTPVGRILNRFTEDINVIDNQLIRNITYFATFLFRAVTVFGVVIYNLPLMAFVIASLLFFYDSFRRYFIPASRELKRLRSARKSPVFSHLQESVSGIDTIVAYGQESRFAHKALHNLNLLISVDQINVHCNRWLSMRLQGLSAVVVYFCTLLILTSLNSSHPIGPGLVGFMMTYILDVTSTLNAIVRTYAEIETKSITIERLVEYCSLKSEADMIVEGNRPLDTWPQNGAIEFKNYETKYRENLDPVLRDISVSIKPAEKIGIVGRTGAGKSTLTLALFRIIEATGGHIEIDGIDTSKIGLFDLRSKLNIIPQDSQAMTGSVRQNLDPFGNHTDEELWKVLELSHLKEHIENMKTEETSDDDDDDEEDHDGAKKDGKIITVGLDAKIEEGGSNLSSGQKQLMCLARALLNPSRVLILDEATASVDVQTDKIVQETIRSEFKDKTILTIAHRIETILDSDRILVLERGAVKEFDSPEVLLKDTESIFYSLCKQGGHI